MLENCNGIKEHWYGVSRILDGWLQQRQKLIVEFCTISGVYDSSLVSKHDTAKNLKNFCEIMVDYISAGHFEVYDHLIQESEILGDSIALDLAKKIYPEVSSTTDIALRFNEKFENITQNENITPNLAHELSFLGENLVTRFELEDSLIENLHYSHKDLIANA